MITHFLNSLNQKHLVVDLIVYNTNSLEIINYRSLQQSHHEFHCSMLCHFRIIIILHNSYLTVRYFTFYRLNKVRAFRCYINYYFMYNRHGC